MLKIHHLRIGRSIFTVWLLEELGLDYELISYSRLETFRAPPELKNVHPLGKSPVIEDDGIIVAESGAIATYLATVYGAKGLVPDAADKAAFARYQHFLHFAEGTLVGPFMMMMVGGTSEQVQGFAQPEIVANLTYLQNELGAQDYIMGDFTLADVGLVCVLGMINQTGVLAGFPALAEYLERCQARPAFARALEKGIE